MKAVAVYPAKHTVNIIDIAEPRIAAPTEVKLRMLEVGRVRHRQGHLRF
jgi:threonine dehydrogenase-like Zn-dependent dehydrogenase